MEERLFSLCGKKKRIKIHTFHGLGYEILREAGIKFLLADAFVLEMLIKKAICKSGVNILVKAAQERISRSKRFLASGGEIHGKDLLLLTSYEQELAHANLMDFDALVGKSIAFFLENKAFQKKFTGKFGAVCIDEYQDLDAAQYRILRFLAENIKSVTVIGDPNQSIYGFRGGDPVFFESFLKNWPETKIFRLIRNYRSTENILNAAWELLQGQKKVPKTDFKVFSDISGKSILLKDCATEKEEAMWIGDAIQKSIGGTGHHAIYAGKDDHTGESWGFSDIGVLVRKRR